jgi:midasin (ATPase involved in ribosome maturation)
LEGLKKLAEPLPPLSGWVTVSATEPLRVRIAPTLTARIIGELRPGERVEMAQVVPVIVDQIERVGMIVWTARGTADDPWLKQIE